MTGKKHLIFGIGCGTLFALAYHPTGLAWAAGTVLASGFGSLLPDIDSRSSIIGSCSKLTSFVCNKLFGHRGFLHSPFCAALFWLGGTVLLSTIYEVSFKASVHAPGYLILAGFIVGYASHLYLDMLTKGGIPLFYPLIKKKINLTRVKTGGSGETALFLFAWVTPVLALLTYFVETKAIVV